LKLSLISKSCKEGTVLVPMSTSISVSGIHAKSTKIWHGHSNTLCSTVSILHGILIEIDSTARTFVNGLSISIIEIDNLSRDANRHRRTPALLQAGNRVMILCAASLHLKTHFIGTSLRRYLHIALAK
jgi:hypothetical protein